MIYFFCLKDLSLTYIFNRLNNILYTFIYLRKDFILRMMFLLHFEIGALYVLVDFFEVVTMNETEIRGSIFFSDEEVFTLDTLDH